MRAISSHRGPRRGHTQASCVRWHRAALAALAAALVLPGVARSDEAGPPRIAAVRFEGVSSVDEGALAEQLLTRAPSWKPWKDAPPFDEWELEADRVTIRSYYANRGWYGADVTTELLWSDDRERVEVVFRVEEGEPVRLATFSLDLPDTLDGEPLDREALLDGLALREGERFGAVAYHEAKRELLARLAGRHHPAARLEGGAEVDPVALTARVAWTLDPGPRVHFGEVTVQGLADVDESLVRRELTFARGDAFSASALDESQARIFGLGLFRSVSLITRPPPATDDNDTDDTGEASWPVEVRVEERKPRSVRVSLGYGTEELVRGALGWQHRNFHGQARQLDLKLQGSALGVAASGKLAQPRFLDEKTSLEVGASAAYDLLPSYDAVRVGAHASLLRPLGPIWSGRLSSTLEFGYVQKIKADDPDLEDTPRLDVLNSFEVGLRRDTTDSPLEPTRGSRLDLSFGPAAGNNVAFVRLLGEVRRYVPIRSTVLGLRLRSGALQPVGRFDATDVPVYKRFFAGGSSSVRGYGFQRVGPLGDDGDPLGGLTLTEGSVELRFPIPLWERLGGAVFVDGGQLSEPAFAWRTQDLFFGAGAGIRVRTPLGPLRLDVGVPIDPRDGFDSFQIHFSVGEAF